MELRKGARVSGVGPMKGVSRRCADWWNAGVEATRFASHKTAQEFRGGQTSVKRMMGQKTVKYFGWGRKSETDKKLRQILAVVSNLRKCRGGQKTVKKGRGHKSVTKLQRGQKTAINFRGQKTA